MTWSDVISLLLGLALAAAVVAPLMLLLVWMRHRFSKRPASRCIRCDGVGCSVCAYTGADQMDPWRYE